MIETVREKIRQPFKINEVAKKFPFKHEESMNSVLVQELARYNGLIEAIHSSLEILELTL
jgi:dynein heavy chain